MKCKKQTNKEGRNGRHRAGDGRGWGGGSTEGPAGQGGFDSLQPLTKRPLLVFPVFLDVEDPLPGQVVMLIVVSKLGLDVVLAAGHQAFRSLLQRGQEVIVGATRPIAAHHVVRLVNCQRKTVDSQRDLLRICAFVLIPRNYENDDKPERFPAEEEPVNLGKDF